MLVRTLTSAVRNAGLSFAPAAAFSSVRGMAYSAVAHAPVLATTSGSAAMARQFFSALFLTLVFAAAVIGILFGIFTLVSYLAGPVGG